MLKHPDGTLEPRVIGPIADYLYAPDDPEAVLQKLSDPATRIVELTVTEGGYNIDHVTGDFDLTTLTSCRRGVSLGIVQAGMASGQGLDG